MSNMAVTGGIYKSYTHIASGKRINGAADDAAGLSIAQKLLKEQNGLDVGAENAQAGIGVMNVADGAMNGITDSLQRMGELAIRSMNGLASDSDRAIYQNEIDQLKGDIQFMARNTSLNEHKLLDGSMADMHLATNPDGSGMKIGMANTTLKSLGIANFDVTMGNFNLDDIGRALDKVSSRRSYLGASTNRLERTYNYNKNASLQQLVSRSRIEDLDMPKAISDKKKEELLSEYRNMALKRQMNQNTMVMRLFQ